MRLQPRMVPGAKSATVVVRVVVPLLPGLMLWPPLRRDAAAFVMLAHDLLARLVGVVLAVQRVLLRSARIVLARVLALVRRERRPRDIAGAAAEDRVVPHLPI